MVPFTKASKRIQDSYRVDEDVIQEKAYLVYLLPQ